MSSQHIEVSGQTRHGAQLRSLVNQLASVQSELTRTKAVYDQLAQDGDYQALAVALGLTGEKAPADAEVIYNLLASVVSEQTGKSGTQQFISRLG